MRNDDVVTATLTGDLDAAAIWTLEQRLFAAVRANPGSTLLLEASGVTFIDASCIGALIRLQRLARVRDVEVIVIRPSPVVRSLIDLTHTTYLMEGAG